MSGSGYSHQDWEPVVIRSSKTAQISKQTHQNPAGTKEFKKLNGDDIHILNKMTREQAQALQQARAAKGLKQKQLASSMSVDVSIIQKYENCTIDNFQKNFYNKMMTFLGVKPNK